MKAEIRWGGKAISYFAFIIVVKTVILLPLIVAFWMLDVMNLFVSLGVIGLVAVDYGIFLRYEQEMGKNLDYAIKHVGLPIILVAGITVSYTCFFIAVILGTYIYGLSQLGLFVPLFWPSFECWISKNKWFLSPSVFLGSLIIDIAKLLDHHSYKPDQDILSIIPDGNLQRILWEKTKRIWDISK